MRESLLRDQVARFLKSLGSECWFTKLGAGPYQRVGLPDFIGSYRGRCFALELKTEANTASPKQADELRKMRASGAEADVFRTLDEVKALFAVLRGGAAVEIADVQDARAPE